ncbi:MAG: hypothetical protein ABJF23_04750 [Bryobacteraceae bacterium]
MMTARERLLALHTALLRLHKAVLDSERAAYEAVHGRIPSPGAFLQLVIHDEWFTWLQAMSGLIVQIDLVSEAKGGVVAADATQILNQTQELLTPDPDGEGFAKRYAAALQRTPEIAPLHKAALEILEAEAEN